MVFVIHWLSGYLVDVEDCLKVVVRGGGGGDDSGGGTDALHWPDTITWPFNGAINRAALLKAIPSHIT